LDYYLCWRMKSLELSTRPNLLNRIMDASVHKGNDKHSLMNSATSLSRKVTVCIIIREVISSNYLINISISIS
jgi:hypothetical protein